MINLPDKPIKTAQREVIHLSHVEDFVEALKSLYSNLKYSVVVLYILHFSSSMR